MASWRLPVPIPAALLGSLDVRGPDPATDAIDGVLPGIVVRPRTAQAVAGLLAWASANRLSVLVRGHATEQSWGRIPRAFDVLLETRDLDRLIAHSPGDLTVTVEAGATLADLNGVLRAHRQHLPIDPPSGAARTIGGILATNDSGPLRHRFGTPRDLLIGVHLATADGRLVKAGGQVVKNVAGYDLGKLVAGSFGELAVIVAATFKLAPLPASTATLVFTADETGAVLAAADAMAGSQLEPVCFEVRSTRRSARTPATECLLRFASVPEAVEAAIAEAIARAGSAGVQADVRRGEDEARTWMPHGSQLDARATMVRVSWLPSMLPEAVEAVAGLPGELEFHLAGRVAAGAGTITLVGNPGDAAAAIERLRASAVLGNVVVTRGSPALKAEADVWGPVPNGGLLKRIKAALDPAGTLGAGRGPA